MSKATKDMVPPESSDEQTVAAQTVVTESREEPDSFQGKQISSVNEAVQAMWVAGSSGSPSLGTSVPETTKHTVKLKSSDGEVLEVDEAVANVSLLVQDMIQAQGSDRPLDLNVASGTLWKVIEYCKYHAENPNTDEDMEATSVTRKWDLKFVTKLDQQTLFSVTTAAHVLRIAGLKDLTCETVAKMITGLRVEEIRRVFGIENDFTPEEEAAIRKENKWAFRYEY